MNLALARAAEKGVRSGPFEQSKGYCLRACRQWAESVPGIGTRYDSLFRGGGEEREATARLAGLRFVKANLGMPRNSLIANGGLQPGDMVVKLDVATNRWGDFSGHIGVMCEDLKRIAENSSTSKGRVRGALGFRTLAEFGSYDVVIRLPDPDAVPKMTKPSVVVSRFDGDGWVDKRIESVLVEDANYLPVQDLLTAAGVRYVVSEWGDGTPNVRIVG